MADSDEDMDVDGRQSTIVDEEAATLASPEHKCKHHHDPSDPISVDTIDPPSR